MANKYVSFISDEHFLNCIEELHKSYLKAKEDISKSKFFKNKIDIIKLTFDSKFNNLNERELIETEILRQIDKSINNSIGTFHEQILGGIQGYEIGNLSGFDIKAKDDSLFAVFGNKELPKIISDALFYKLAEESKFYKNGNFYFVLMDDFTNLNKKWVIGDNELQISNKRVFIVSIKDFYGLLSNDIYAYEKVSKSVKDILGIHFEELNF